MSSRYLKIAVFTLLALSGVAVCTIWAPYDLNTALNIVRTLAVLGTLVIAILLYDRFGLKKDIMSRKMTTVLELASALREPQMFAQSEQTGYHLTFSGNLFATIQAIQGFEQDKDKHVCVELQEYQAAMHPVLSFKDDILLPDEIKRVLQNLVINRIIPVSDLPYQGDTILVVFGRPTEGGNGATGKFSPSMTFEQFVRQVENVATTVQNWIRDHADTSISVEGY